MGHKVSGGLYSEDQTVKNIAERLIPVVVKRSRLSHSHKFWGALLHKERKQYINHQFTSQNPLEKLNEQAVYARETPAQAR